MTHGCIICPGCGAGCPLCGRCQCKIEDLREQCWCGNGPKGTYHSCGIFTGSLDSGYWKKLPDPVDDE